MRGSAKILGWLTVICIIQVAPAWADMQAGGEAYKRGDFVEAFEELMPLADAGHAEAQLMVGLMYKTGRGVPQDFTEAAKWMRRSADQGESSAQGILGIMYLKAEGVPRDLVKAHLCFSVAGAQGQDDGFKARDSIEQNMSQDEISRARRLASECAEKDYKGCEF